MHLRLLVGEEEVGTTHAFSVRLVYAKTHGRDSGDRCDSPYAITQRSFSAVVRISPNAASTTVPPVSPTSRSEGRTRFPCVPARNSTDPLLLRDDPVEQTPHHASTLRKGRVSPFELSNLGLSDALCDLVPRRSGHDGEEVTRARRVGGDVIAHRRAGWHERGVVEMRANRGLLERIAAPAGPAARQPRSADAGRTSPQRGRSS